MGADTDTLGDRVWGRVQACTGPGQMGSLQASMTHHWKAGPRDHVPAMPASLYIPSQAEELGLKKRQHTLGHRCKENVIY